MFGLALTDLALLALPFVAGWGLLATETGLRAVAALAGRVVSGLQIEVASGSVLSSPRLSRLTYDDGRTRIELGALALDWQPSALLRGRLVIDRLAADALRVATSPSDEPPTTPASLELPLALQARIEVARIEVGSHDAPASEALTLGPLQLTVESDGSAYRVGELSLATPWGALSGEAGLKGSAPFPLQGRLALKAGQYAVDAVLGGTLAERTDIALTAQGHGLSGSARVAARPFAAQPLQSATLALDAFDPHSLHPAAPAGRWTVNAELAPRGDTPTPLVGRIEARNAEPGRIDQGRAPVTSIAADIEAAPDAVDLRGLAIALAGGGSIRGDVGWRRAGALPLEALLTLHDIDTAALHRQGVRTRIGGTVAVHASDTRQQFELALDDRGSSRLALKADGAVDGSQLTLASARLAARGAEATLRGTLALDDTLAFKAEGRLQQFDPSAFVKAPAAKLSARFDAAGRLRPQPDLQAAVDIEPSVLAGEPLAGRARARLQGQRLSGVDIALDWGGNTLTAQGAFGGSNRGNKSGGAQDALDWMLDARRLGALKSFTGQTLAGSLSGSGRLEGTLAAPNGRMTLAARALALGSLGSVASADLAAELAPGADGRMTLSLDAADLRAPQLPQAVERLQAELTGTRAAHALTLDVLAAAPPAERGDTPVKPSLKLAARGGLSAGSDAAGPAWSGTLDRLALVLSSELSATLGAPARLAASPQAVTLEGAGFALTGGGELTLARTAWTPERIEAAGRARGVPLRLVWRDRAAGIAVRAPLKLGADWSLSALLAGDDRVDGTLAVFREAGDVVVSGDTRAELALSAARVDARLAGRGANVQAVLAGPDIGEMKAEIALPLRREGSLWQPDLDAPVGGKATLAVPSLAWIGRTLRLDMSTAGRMNGDVTLAGTLRTPRLSGRVDGDALAFALVDAGVRLERGSLRAQFEGDRLTLQSLSFESDNRRPPPDARLGGNALSREPGRLTARGSVALATTAADIELDIRRFVPLQGGEQWLMLSGDGRLRGSAKDGQKLQLGLKADAGLFTVPEQSAPALGDDVVVKGRTVDEPAGPPLGLAIDIDLGERLYFKGRGLDTRLAGQLALRDEGRGLRATGNIRTADGRYRAYGQDLVIERGIISFQGSVSNPGLNVRAIRPNLPVQAGVEVSGTVQKPRVRLVSDSAMPDSEKLSWIVLGRGQDRAGGSDLSLLATAASALLGGEGEGVTGSLAQALGLDQIALTQSSTSTGPRSQVVSSSSSTSTVGGQVVSVGKRLSSNALLTYEQGVAGAISIVKLTWNLTRHLALIGSTGTEQAVDVRYVFSFK
ncbi:MAG: hypothetical protein GY848_15225 [Methyloversatilis sp.]|nr:hypothetical protein [Methyloversatilis sp.]